MAINSKDIFTVILALVIGYLVVQNIQLTKELKTSQEEQKEQIFEAIHKNNKNIEELYHTQNALIDSTLQEAKHSKEIAKRVEKQQTKLSKDNEDLINSFNSMVWDRPDF